jgi:DNA polymerase bacteriophage-type
VPRRRFLLDIESTSTVDLRAAGAAAYWEHADTQIICVCYRVDDGPVIRWEPNNNVVPYFAGQADDLDHFRVVAHNYLFEYFAWQHKLAPVYGWRLPRLSAWDCTMARALYWGLPAGLGDACDALALPITKDAAARPLMLRMAKPRSTNPLTWWHETDPAKLKALIDYCEQDVLAECALDDALPELPAFERDLFLIDGEINLRGVGVDLDLTGRLASYTKIEANRLNTRMCALTQGRVKTTNQVQVITDELNRLGLTVPSLAKGDVSAALEANKIAAGIVGDAKIAQTILEVRQEAAKASTAKLTAIAKGASTDHRCRGILQYGGAGRTMRWAGRRAQPQNFPRGSVKGLASVYPMIEAGVPRDDLDALLPGSVMDGIASMLRGCFVAKPGYVLVSGDLSQIEARVLPWLAGQNDVLAVFAKGDDVYTYMARRVGSENRQFGKVLTLACGYGMGGPKFQDTAKTYGVVLTEDEARTAVAAWRQVNDRSVQLWWDVDAAFRMAARSPHGTAIQVGRFLTVRKTRKAVRIALPSTHELIYQNVELVPDPERDGRESITFMGVDQKTKKWSRQRTYGGKLCENVVQATARDVMGEAMRTARKASVPVVMTVHDELLAEAPEVTAEAALAHLLRIMSTTPAWAPGLPVAAEGWTGRRYRKG